MEAEYIPPKTLRAYFESMGETIGIIGWLVQEFVSGETRRKYKHLLTWSALWEAARITQPWIMAVGLAAFADLDVPKLMEAYGAFVGARMLLMIFDWRASLCREWLSGENHRTLERGINQRFFSKELGLHIERNDILCQSSMEKGRERAIQVSHLVIFTATETIVSLVVTTALLFLISFMAGSIFFFLLCATMLISIVLNKKLMLDSDPIDREYRSIIRRRSELWEAVERVETSGQAAIEIATMDARFVRMIGGDRAVWFRYIHQALGRNLFNEVVLAVVVFLMGREVLSGSISVPVFLSALTWITIALGHVRTLGRLERDFGQAIPSIKRMREALELPVQVVDAPTSIALPYNGPVRLEVRGVSHAYANGRRVLNNVSFTVEPRQRVALIGPSGSGKTTLLRAMQRFMDPTDGAFFVNGHHLQHGVQRQSWTALSALIPQRPQILDGTLRENLLYALSVDGRTAMSDADLWAFMRHFQIDFGPRLNKGLDTMVGRHGVQLSGGEAQRVMIGAAALKRPRIMFIDEATSSLDAESQYAVQSALDALLAEIDASAVTVAHRLSTIRRHDTFVVLRPVNAIPEGEGQVETIAHSFAELFERSPIFRRLAELEGIAL